MKITTQISIFLENKPGVFARVCSSFAKEKVNILAIMVEDAADHAVVRMVVDDTRKAKDIIEDHSAVSLENEILAIDMANQPGALVEIAEKLSASKINIDYAYGSTVSEDNGRATIYVRVDDVVGALKVLQG